MSDLEKGFLKNFFEFLNREHVDYAVLRNYETLPETVPGTDIDLIIGEKDFKRVERALDKVSFDTDYKLWKKFPKPWFLTHYKYSPVTPQSPQDIVKIDFMRGGVKWLDWPLMSMEEIKAGIIIHNGIRVLNKPQSTTITLLNKWMSNGVLQEKYGREYRALSDADKDYVNNGLQQLFGRYSRVLIAQLVNGATSFNHRAIKWRFLMKKRFYLPGIVSGLWYLCFVSTLGRIFRPAGEFVCVIGPDGTGKTSLVDRVQAGCIRMYKRLDRFHHYPLLKAFSFIDRKSTARYKKRLSEGAEWENRQKKHSTASSLFRSCYQLFRFWAGYIFWIYPERVKGSLVVGERWCYDWLIDPRSKGICLPFWVRRVFYGLCPKPDKVIVVKCRPEVAAQRKGELPAAEIARQQELIDRLVVPSNRARGLENDGTLDEGFRRLLNILCE